ncbi:hypothetical protein Tco_0111342 [Tanacetum coccineum]
MDSGGSYHITYKRDYLFDFKMYDSGNLLLSDVRECRVQRTGKVQVQMRDGSSFMLDNVRYVPELRRNLISLGTLEKEGFTVKIQLDKIKVIKGSLVLLSGTRRANCVYTLDGHAVTKKTLKGRKQLGEYQTRWKIKMGNVLDSCNQRYEFSAMLQGVEFEVEPQEDHTFEVEHHGNVDHVVGSQEVQTQDLIYYHLALDKIYAHESLTFNNIVACEVISMWGARLKDDINARSDVYVLSNDCRKCRDYSDGYYWELVWAYKGFCWIKAKGKCTWYGDRQGSKCGYVYMRWKARVSGLVARRLDIASEMWAAKEAIWLKGLAIESGFELKIVAGIATGALSKAIPGPRFQHRLNLLSIGIG